jgi:hypothetical protein
MESVARGLRARPTTLFVASAGMWGLTCLRWFDAGRSLRPTWLELLPPALLLALTAALAATWLLLERELWRPSPGLARSWAPVVTGLLAFGVRLPLAVWGAAGYLTADGALSGLVMLRLSAAREHFVFVPAVPYSGSLKSHLAAPLLTCWDPAVAFALASLVFYALAVWATACLALRCAGPRAAWAAGLYLTLAPAFVTQYSLSNDGNYVEVLALGPCALLLVLRALDHRPSAPAGAPLLAAGVLLGLAFWCHILALIPSLAVAAMLALACRASPRALGHALGALGAGWLVGYAPGAIWNATHGGESFRYLVPGLQPVGEGPPVTLGQRVHGLLFDHLPILMGDHGGASDASAMLARALAWGALLVLALGLFGVLRALAWSRTGTLAAEPRRARAALLLLGLVNLGVATLALPYLPGNPRYLLFLATPAAVLVGTVVAHWRRAGPALLVVMLVFGAWGSAEQARLKLAADRDWRRLAAGLMQTGAGYCYSDFYIATKLTFLTGERVLCTSKLGPTTTEYFFEYRSAVEQAPRAAYVATTGANGDKLARRLERLGVTFRRRDDLMKPLLFELSRKVDPQELFPERSFPMR